MTQAAAADRGVDFEVARLDEYLKSWLGGAGPVRVRRTQGGMSNPTYFVTRGDWRAVLRKQPNNVLMPSAHAVDREYRVLTALQGSRRADAEALSLLRRPRRHRDAVLSDGMARRPRLSRVLDAGPAAG